MDSLHTFHTLITELLIAIGFIAPKIEENQQIISLAAAKIGDIHFGLIDENAWFMQIDLLQIDPRDNIHNALLWLRHNQLSNASYQPVIALDEDNRLICWLKLPLLGCDLTMQLAAFDALLKSAEQLLAAGEEDGVAFHTQHRHFA